MKIPELKSEWSVDTGEMSKILGHELSHVDAIAQEGGLPSGTNFIIYDDADFRTERYYRSGAGGFAKTGKTGPVSQNADTHAVMAMGKYEIFSDVTTLRLLTPRMQRLFGSALVVYKIKPKCQK